jgi:hypothetical protein
MTHRQPSVHGKQDQMWAVGLVVLPLLANGVQDQMWAVGLVVLPLLANGVPVVGEGANGGAGVVAAALPRVALVVQPASGPWTVVLVLLEMAQALASTALMAMWI